EGDADRTARGRVDRSIDADHIAIHVECGTAGISLIDRRIDLNVVIVRTRSDVASLCRYDTGGYRAAKTKGIADCHDPIADSRRVISEMNVGEFGLSVDFDECKIRL